MDATLLLLLLLVLLPKENVVMCCCGFWLAPNVNTPGAVLLSFVFAKTEVEAMVGVPNVDGCVPNGDALLLSLNAGGPFAVTVVPMPNVGLGEMTFWPTNVPLDGADELK